MNQYVLILGPIILIFYFLTTLNGLLSLFGVTICHSRLWFENGLVM